MLGCPELGDPVYGSSAATARPVRSATLPLHLHARALSLPYAESGPPIAVQAPVPAHMRKALEACGFRGG